jgi:hypothetical protein
MTVYNEVLSPLPCFGNITFYHHLLEDDVIIDRHEHYVKQTLRNRYELTGAQGRFFLTIPVLGQRGMKLPATDIAISYETEWQHQHVHAIKSNYGSSPFYEHYANQIFELINSRCETLYEFNIKAHDLVCSFLKTSDYLSDKGLRLSDEYIESSPGLDLRGSFKSGAEGFNSYLQVFSDRCAFESDLSVLDLIFCSGPQAHSYIINQR